MKTNALMIFKMNSAIKKKSCSVCKFCQFRSSAGSAFNRYSLLQKHSFEDSTHFKHY